MINTQLNLSDRLGVAVLFDPETGIVAGDGIASAQPEPRTVTEMTPFLYQKAALPATQPIYFMTRDVHRITDLEEIKARNLRFDLTSIEPVMLTDEYPKTIGHYHPVKPGTDLSYPELYSIISGTGLVLLQREAHSGSVDEALAVQLTTGDQLIIPPNFGHITINLGPVPLILGNWVARSMISDYSQYREHHGGAYYIVRSNRGPQLISDKAYSQVSPIREVLPQVPEKLLSQFAPIYTEVVSRLVDFNFLTHPESSTLWSEELFVEAPHRLFHR